MVKLINIAMIWNLVTWKKTGGGGSIFKSLLLINQDLAYLCYFDVHIATGIIFFFSIYPHDTGISLAIAFNSFLRMVILGDRRLHELKIRKPRFFYINHSACMAGHLKSWHLFSSFLRCGYCLLWKNQKAWDTGNSLKILTCRHGLQTVLKLVSKFSISIEKTKWNFYNLSATSGKL